PISLPLFAAELAAFAIFFDQPAPLVGPVTLRIGLNVEQNVNELRRLLRRERTFLISEHQHIDCRRSSKARFQHQERGGFSRIRCELRNEITNIRQSDSENAEDEADARNQKHRAPPRALARANAVPARQFSATFRASLNRIRSPEHVKPAPPAVRMLIDPA